MSKLVYDGYSRPLKSSSSSSGGDGVGLQGKKEEEEEAPVVAEQPESTVEYTGGGFYLITHPDGSTEKIRGKTAAYEAAGLDAPEEE